MSQCLIARMRDGERDVFGSQLLREHCGLAVELDGWPLPFRANDFNIAPADAVIPPCAQGLHSGLLGGKAGGVTFVAAGFALAVLDLAVGVYAMEKPLAEALDRFSNARHFGDVHSRADNHGDHCQSGPCNWQLEA